MMIALDFDETYNCDPELWNAFIISARLRGHDVILVTYRHETLDYDVLFEDLRKLHVNMFFTDGKAKGPFLEDLGVKPDVWIDDNPASIAEDSKWKHNSPELHAWRVQNIKGAH